MDYNSFEIKILDKLQRRKKCDKVIKENVKLVREYFINPYSIQVRKNFINKLNDVILKSKKYDEIEKFLKHPAMTEVLTIFRQSDILVRALQDKNKTTVKWLLTMDIDTSVRDKLGRIALMYASEYWEFESIAEKLVKENPDSVNIADEDGNTALFHAVKVKKIFDKLVAYNIITNYRNKKGDTIFTHICRCHKPKCIKSLLRYHHDVDFSVVNNDGRTGAMYLAESDNFTEIRGLHAMNKNLNLGYKNKMGDTIVSLTIQRYYDQFRDGIDASNQAIRDKLGGFAGKYYDRQYSREYTSGKNMGRTINTLIDTGCDFNCTVDGDGNTPMIFFLMIKDYVSALNLLLHVNHLDLSLCNKYGVNASYLCSILTPSDFNSLMNVKDDIFMKINYKIFMEAVHSNKTYISKDIVEVRKNIISPYEVPERILSLQSALSEGYFARGYETNEQVYECYVTEKLLEFEYGQKI